MKMGMKVHPRAESLDDHHDSRNKLMACHRMQMFQKI